MKKQLSKTLSYLLRHHPEDADLEPDSQGFVSIDRIVYYLNKKQFPDLTPKKVAEKIQDPSVERFECRGAKIRATYGHSIPINPEYPEIYPLVCLYHGTSHSAWEQIEIQGIKPMNREFVHLSRTLEEARRVGRRHDNQPVILRISIPKGTDRSFYRAGSLILTKYVPADWIDVDES